MDEMLRIDRAAEAVEAAVGRADIAVILGSGLGAFGDTLEDTREIAYERIPDFPRATVPGHAGKFITGQYKGVRALLMSGRFHGYEGYSMRDVTLPVRVMARLGVKTLVVTNAAGGVNTSFSPGDLMLISDFINLSGQNPLRGENLSAFGTRFPDMSRAYDEGLRGVAKAVASRLGVDLKEGVYCLMNGPCYETPAEIRMIRALGADAVGMSTVPETIVARHCGIRVLGVSCITNMAAGVLDHPINHAEVMETGARVREVFRRVLLGVIEKIG